jgi:hypothetical protein
MRALNVLFSSVLFLYLGLPGSALAMESTGTLGEVSSEKFAAYYFRAYYFSPSPEKRFQVVLRSKEFDSYLMLVQPDGSILANDEVNPPHGDTKPTEPYGTAGIVVDRPAAGLWMLVAATYRPGEKGDYALEYQGISGLEPAAPSSERAKAVAAAFANRGVEDPAVRRDALREQLTLRSFRAELTLRLQGEITEHEKAEKELRERLASLEERQRQLSKAVAAVEGLAESRDLIRELVKADLDTSEKKAEKVSEELITSVGERSALDAALSQLGRLDSVANELAQCEDSLVQFPSTSSTEQLSTKIVRLRREQNLLGGELAAKLLDSHIVLDPRLGGFGFWRKESRLTRDNGRILLNRALDLPTGRIEIGTRLDGASIIATGRDLDLQVGRVEIDNPINGAILISAGRNIAQRVGGVAIDGALGFPSRVQPRLDPSVWLPALLPWPPPDPSSRVVLERRLIEAHHSLPTLGDLDSTLHAALSAAGYTGCSYWGVPGGFAVVTPLEQTNSVGSPLADDRRWIGSIVEMKSFTLSEYLRALLTAPRGYFRVLAFVISTEPFTGSGARARLETIERWSRVGFNFLPDPIRTEAFTGRHRVTVLVYEFLKKRDSDRPMASVPGRLAAQDHLRATRLASLLEANVPKRRQK